MELSLEQIKNVTVGALDIRQESDGFHFYKCTQKQIDAWYTCEQVLGERSEQTTGVRLDFHTNSTTFAFKVKTNAKYEIYIDNLLTYAYGPTDIEDGTEKEIVLDGNEHRITLYLPGHSVGVLEWVCIDNDAIIKSHKYDCKILFLGDSITQGWDSTWDSLSYAQRVSRHFNADSVIQGIGGAIFNELAFDEDIVYDPDIVIVAYGTNDWCRYATLEEGRTQCEKFLDAVMKKYGDKKVFGISPLWRWDCNEMPSMGSFHEWTSCVKEEIQKHGMILIAGETLVPHISDFYIDELHPNTIGFGIYAQNLILEMKKRG